LLIVVAEFAQGGTFTSRRSCFNLIPVLCIHPRAIALPGDILGLNDEADSTELWKAP